MTREASLGFVLPPPWDAFLGEVDAELSQAVEIHCLGGFVLHVLFNLPRPTADIDFVSAAPTSAANELLRIAGPGTPLAKKHRLYLQLVTVSDFPDDYEARLIDIAPRTLSNLRLRALSPEDLLLAKLTRNSPKDVHDVRFLAEKGAIDPTVLKERYQEHLRPYLANVERHDLTLDLWLEEIEAVAPGKTGG
jgi:hypothetical protein